MYLKFLVVLLVFAAVASAQELQEQSSCPTVKTCSKPKKYKREYECQFDKNCQDGFACCEHGCYLHKICQKKTKVVHEEEEKNSSKQDIKIVGGDKEWNVNQVQKEKIIEEPETNKEVLYCPATECKAEPKAHKSSLCHSDGMCPDGSKCCHHACYTHKVCSEAQTRKPANLPLLRGYEIPDNNIDVIDPTCPPRGDCEQIFKYEDTRHLQCESCNPEYSCCPDCKFSHRICRRSINVTAVINADVEVLEPKYSFTVDKNNCLVESKKCALIPYKQSKNLECNSNFDCPIDFFCCSDKCYTHKICKKGVLETSVDYSKCPKLEESCRLNSALKLSRGLECNKNVKCAVGQVCCPSACFGYNICKDPVKIKKEHPKEYEEANSGKEYFYGKCPLPSSKCNVGWSMTRMMEIACNDETDCKENQICCWNPCPKFKVCTSKYNIEAINEAWKNGDMGLESISAMLQDVQNS